VAPARRLPPPPLSSLNPRSPDLAYLDLSSLDPLSLDLAYPDSLSLVRLSLDPLSLEPPSLDALPPLGPSAR
jgi:hypothetical protein